MDKCLVAAVLIFTAIPGRSLSDLEPAAGAVHAQPIDLDQYRQKLQEIDTQLAQPAQNRPGREQRVTAQDLLITVPGEYDVQCGGHDYVVSMEWLRNGLSQLAAASTEKQPDMLTDLRKQIARRRNEANSLAQTNPEFDATAQHKADAILAGREFHRVNKPEVWRQFLQALYLKVLDLLSRLSGHPVGAYLVSTIFVWVVIAAVCCGLLFWLWRWLQRPAPTEDSRVPVLFAASRKSWRVWLREAQDAAERGDFREAVHLAYWAAVSRLEDAGAWPADRTRTPREYLAFLKPANPDREVLLTLTRNFELIWYGNRPATQDHFQEARLKVEALHAR